MGNIDNLSDKIVDNLYEELRNLLQETKQYFQVKGRVIRKDLSTEDRVNYLINMTAIVAIQTPSLAWILAYKAYRNKEITKEDLINDFTMDGVPEVEHNNIESLQPILTRTVGMNRLVKRHINNLKGE